MSGDAPILAVHGLVKDYGKVHAVRGLDFELRRAEILGFLGPNGAGKSTTIRCLLDLLRPTSGKIEIFGLDPRQHGVEIRRRLTYVPGELRLPEKLTGAQLLEAMARIRGHYDRARRNRLTERLKLDLTRPARELSSGNRRKLVLLLAFLWPVELMILDEPTSGLDPLMQHEFLALVREARESGSTVFLSSHVLGEVQRIADRVIVVQGGRIMAQGTVEELRSRGRRRLEIDFSMDLPAAAVDGLPSLDEVVLSGHRVSAILCGPVRPLLGALAALPVSNLLIEEPDLEEAFLDLYEEAA